MGGADLTFGTFPSIPNMEKKGKTTKWGEEQGASEGRKVAKVA